MPEGQVVRVGSHEWEVLWDVHTGAVDMAEGEVMEIACHVVSGAMRQAGSGSCVYGVRLLCDLLAGARLEHNPIAVRLTVYDPDATAGRPGRVIVVGDRTGETYEGVQMGQPGDFEGHLVALARASGAVHLLDPTVFQVECHWEHLPLKPPATSLVLKLRQQALELASQASGRSDGWSYEYEPTPQVDWRERDEWVATDRFRLHTGIRREFSKRTGIVFADPGRNERCPCASGRKFKSCCINKGYFD